MSDNLQMPDAMRIFVLETQLSAVTAERDKLKAEVVRLSGETGFCTECERQAREIARLKEEREQLEKQPTVKAIMADGSGMRNVYLHPPVPDGKVLVDAEPTDEDLLRWLLAADPQAVRLP